MFVELIKCFVNKLLTISCFPKCCFKIALLVQTAADSSFDNLRWQRHASATNICKPEIRKYFFPRSLFDLSICFGLGSASVPVHRQSGWGPGRSDAGGYHRRATWGVRPAYDGGQCSQQRELHEPGDHQGLSCPQSQPHQRVSQQRDFCW